MTESIGRTMSGSAVFLIIGAALLVVIFGSIFVPRGPGGLSGWSGLDLGFNLVVLTPPETSRVSSYGRFSDFFKLVC